MLDTLRARNLTMPFALLAALVLAAVIALLPVTSAVLVVGAVAGGAVVLRYPLVALILLIFAIPFGSLAPLPLAGANVTAADGLLVVLIALWVARMIAAREIRIRWGGLSLPFAIFLLAAGVSVTGALSLQAAAKEMVKWVEMWLAYVWVVNNLDLTGLGDLSGLPPRWVIAALFLAGITQALLGFYQFFLRVGPKGFLLFEGAYLRAYGTFEQPNPYAGYLALVVPVAFAVVLGIRNSKFKIRNWRTVFLILAAITLATTLAATGMSFSRGAWMAGAAGMVATLLVGLAWGAFERNLVAGAAGVVMAGAAYIFLRDVTDSVTAVSGAGILAVSAFFVTRVAVGRRRVFPLLGLMIAVGAIFVLGGGWSYVPATITERFAGITDYLTVFDVRGVKVTDANFALVERMAHWQAAWNTFSEHPWLGVGFGNYAAVYPAYALPHWGDPLGHAHNYFLNVLAESGVVGLAAYVLLWGAIFWRGLRGAGERGSGGAGERGRRGAGAQGSRGAGERGSEGDGEKKALMAGLIGTLVVLTMFNLFDNLLVHSIQMEIGIVLGLLEVVQGDKETSKQVNK